MSPEQLKGEDATPRSDIYSVGVLLYHCLTGRPPFSGDVRSLARQHIHKDPTPPRKLNKRITPGMEAVILKALSKDPRDRYFSANAMLDDIGIEVQPKAGDDGAAQVGPPQGPLQRPPRRLGARSAAPPRRRRGARLGACRPSSGRQRGRRAEPHEPRRHENPRRRRRAGPHASRVAGTSQP